MMLQPLSVVLLKATRLEKPSIADVWLSPTHLPGHAEACFGQFVGTSLSLIHYTLLK